MRPMRSGALAALSIGLLIFGLAGGGAAQTSSPAATAVVLESSNWLLTAVGDSLVPTGIDADLVFVAGDAGGLAGCNDYFASYTTDGASTLTFGDIASTRKSCDTATDAFETSYLTALATVATYRAGSGNYEMDLADGTGAVVLAYAAYAAVTVEGPWIVTRYGDGKGGVEAVSADFAPSVAFGPDGGVEGFDGCNDFSGGYSVNGTAIAIGPLMSTLKSCGDTIDARSTAFLAALQASATWSVSAGTLDLRDASGAQQVEASSAIGH